MRVLVTGADGMLARDILAAQSEHELVGATRAELDITDADACRLAAIGFDAIINCAAYTNVDAAETDEAAAYTVNALGPQNLAEAAAANDAVLVQVSTDYVFDGTSSEPYAEGAPLAPLGAYGRTKAAGEELAAAANADTIIVRIAWLYGVHGSNFVSTMLRLAEERDTLTVVNDQHGQPTSTTEAAAAILAILDARLRQGVFHATCEGQTTWHGLASEALRLAGHDPARVQPVTSAEFVRPAPRPAYSVLAHTAMSAVRSPSPWQDALENEMRRMGALAAEGGRS